MWNPEQLAALADLFFDLYCLRQSFGSGSGQNAAGFLHGSLRRETVTSTLDNDPNATGDFGDGMSDRVPMEQGKTYLRDPTNIFFQYYMVFYTEDDIGAGPLDSVEVHGHAVAHLISWWSDSNVSKEDCRRWAILVPFYSKTDDLKPSKLHFCAEFSRENGLFEANNGILPDEFTYVAGIYAVNNTKSENRLFFDDGDNESADKSLEILLSLMTRFNNQLQIMYDAHSSYLSDCSMFASLLGLLVFSRYTEVSDITPLLDSVVYDFIFFDYTEDELRNSLNAVHDDSMPSEADAGTISTPADFQEWSVLVDNDSKDLLKGLPLLFMAYSEHIFDSLQKEMAKIKDKGTWSLHDPSSSSSSQLISEVLIDKEKTSDSVHAPRFIPRPGLGGSKDDIVHFPNASTNHVCSLLDEVDCQPKSTQGMCEWNDDISFCVPVSDSVDPIQGIDEEIGVITGAQKRDSLDKMVTHEFRYDTDKYVHVTDKTLELRPRYSRPPPPVPSRNSHDRVLNTRLRNFNFKYTAIEELDDIPDHKTSLSVLDEYVPPSPLEYYDDLFHGAKIARKRVGDINLHNAKDRVSYLWRAFVTKGFLAETAAALDAPEVTVSPVPKSLPAALAIIQNPMNHQSSLYHGRLEIMMFYAFAKNRDVTYQSFQNRGVNVDEEKYKAFAILKLKNMLGNLYLDLESHALQLTSSSHNFIDYEYVDGAYAFLSVFFSLRAGIYESLLLSSSYAGNSSNIKSDPSCTFASFSNHYFPNLFDLLQRSSDNLVVELLGSYSKEIGPDKKKESISLADCAFHTQTIMRIVENTTTTTGISFFMSNGDHTSPLHRILQALDVKDTDFAPVTGIFDPDKKRRMTMREIQHRAMLSVFLAISKKILERLEKNGQLASLKESVAADSSLNDSTKYFPESFLGHAIRIILIKLDCRETNGVFVKYMCQGGTPKSVFMSPCRALRLKCSEIHESPGSSNPICWTSGGIMWCATFTPNQENWKLWVVTPGSIFDRRILDFFVKPRIKLAEEMNATDLDSETIESIYVDQLNDTGLFTIECLDEATQHYRILVADITELSNTTTVDTKNLMAHYFRCPQEIVSFRKNTQKQFSRSVKLDELSPEEFLKIVESAKKKKNSPHSQQAKMIANSDATECRLLFDLKLEYPYVPKDVTPDNVYFAFEQSARLFARRAFDVDSDDPLPFFASPLSLIERILKNEKFPEFTKVLIGQTKNHWLTNFQRIWSWDGDLRANIKPGNGERIRLLTRFTSDVYHLNFLFLLEHYHRRMSEYGVEDLPKSDELGILEDFASTFSSIVYFPRQESNGFSEKTPTRFALPDAHHNRTSVSRHDGLVRTDMWKKLLKYVSGQTHIFQLEKTSGGTSISLFADDGCWDYPFLEYTDRLMSIADADGNEGSLSLNRQSRYRTFAPIEPVLFEIPSIPSINESDFHLIPTDAMMRLRDNAIPFFYGDAYQMGRIASTFTVGMGGSPHLYSIITSNAVYRYQIQTYRLSLQTMLPHKLPDATHFSGERVQSEQYDANTARSAFETIQDSIYSIMLDCTFGNSFKEFTMKSQNNFNDALKNYLLLYHLLLPTGTTAFAKLNNLFVAKRKRTETGDEAMRDTLMDLFKTGLAGQSQLLKSKIQNHVKIFDDTFRTKTSILQQHYVMQHFNGIVMSNFRELYNTRYLIRKKIEELMQSSSVKALWVKALQRANLDKEVHENTYPSVDRFLDDAATIFSRGGESKDKTRSSLEEALQLSLKRYPQLVLTSDIPDLSLVYEQDFSLYVALDDATVEGVLKLFEASASSSHHYCDSLEYCVFYTGGFTKDMLEKTTFTDGDASEYPGHFCRCLQVANTADLSITHLIPCISSNDFENLSRHFGDSNVQGHFTVLSIQYRPYIKLPPAFSTALRVFMIKKNVHVKVARRVTLAPLDLNNQNLPFPLHFFSLNGDNKKNWASCAYSPWTHEPFSAIQADLRAFGTPDLVKRLVSKSMDPRQVTLYTEKIVLRTKDTAGYKQCAWFVYFITLFFLQDKQKNAFKDHNLKPDSPSHQYFVWGVVRSLYEPIGYEIPYHAFLQENAFVVFCALGKLKQYFPGCDVGDIVLEETRPVWNKSLIGSLPNDKKTLSLPGANPAYTQALTETTGDVSASAIALPSVSDESLNLFLETSPRITKIPLPDEVGGYSYSIFSPLDLEPEYEDTFIVTHGKFFYDILMSLFNIPKRDFYRVENVMLGRWKDIFGWTFDRHTVFSGRTFGDSHEFVYQTPLEFSLLQRSSALDESFLDTPSGDTKTMALTPSAKKKRGVKLLGADVNGLHLVAATKCLLRTFNIAAIENMMKYDHWDICKALDSTWILGKTKERILDRNQHALFNFENVFSTPYKSYVWHTEISPLGHYLNSDRVNPFQDDYNKSTPVVVYLSPSDIILRQSLGLSSGERFTMYTDVLLSIHKDFHAVRVNLYEIWVQWYTPYWDAKDDAAQLADATKFMVRIQQAWVRATFDRTDANNGWDVKFCAQNLALRFHVHPIPDDEDQLIISVVNAITEKMLQFSTMTAYSYDLISHGLRGPLLLPAFSTNYEQFLRAHATTACLVRDNIEIPNPDDITNDFLRAVCTRFDGLCSNSRSLRRFIYALAAPDEIRESMRDCSFVCGGYPLPMPARDFEQYWELQKTLITIHGHKKIADKLMYTSLFAQNPLEYEEYLEVHGKRAPSITPGQIGRAFAYRYKDFLLTDQGDDHASWYLSYINYRLWFSHAQNVLYKSSNDTSDFLRGSEEGEVVTILFWAQDSSRATITEDVITHTFFLEFLLFAKLLWSKSKFSDSDVKAKQKLEAFSQWLFEIISWDEPLHSQHFLLDSYLRYRGTASDSGTTWIDHLVSNQFIAPRSYIRHISLFLTPYHIVYSGDAKEKEKKTPLSGWRELDNRLQYFSFMGREVDYVLNHLFLSFFLHNGPRPDQAEPQEDEDQSNKQEVLNVTVKFTPSSSGTETKEEIEIKFKIPVYRNLGQGVPSYDTSSETFMTVRDKILDTEAPPQVKRWALLCKGDLRSKKTKTQNDLRPILAKKSTSRAGMIKLKTFKNIIGEVEFTWESGEVDESSQEICDPYSGRQDNDLILIPKENKSQIYTKDMLQTQETWEESQAMLNVNDTDAHMTWSESTSFQNFVIRDLLRDRNLLMLGHGDWDTVSKSTLGGLDFSVSSFGVRAGPIAPAASGGFDSGAWTVTSTSDNPTVQLQAVKGVTADQLLSALKPKKRKDYFPREVLVFSNPGDTPIAFATANLSCEQHIEVNNVPQGSTVKILCHWECQIISVTPDGWDNFKRLTTRPAYPFALIETANTLQVSSLEDASINLTVKYPAYAQFKVQRKNTLDELREHLFATDDSQDTVSLRQSDVRMKTLDKIRLGTKIKLTGTATDAFRVPTHENLRKSLTPGLSWSQAGLFLLGLNFIKFNVHHAKPSPFDSAWWKLIEEKKTAVIELLKTPRVQSLGRTDEHLWELRDFYASLLPRTQADEYRHSIVEYLSQDFFSEIWFADYDNLVTRIYRANASCFAEGLFPDLFLLREFKAYFLKMLAVEHIVAMKKANEDLDGVEAILSSYPLKHGPPWPRLFSLLDPPVTMATRSERYTTTNEDVPQNSNAFRDLMRHIDSPALSGDKLAKKITYEFGLWDYERPNDMIEIVPRSSLDEDVGSYNGFGTYSVLASKHQALVVGPDVAISFLGFYKGGLTSVFRGLSAETNADTESDFCLYLNEQQCLLSDKCAWLSVANSGEGQCLPVSTDVGRRYLHHYQITDQSGTVLNNVFVLGDSTSEAVFYLSRKRSGDDDDLMGDDEHSNANPKLQPTDSDSGSTGETKIVKPRANQDQTSIDELFGDVMNTDEPPSGRTQCPLYDGYWEAQDVSKCGMHALNMLAARVVDRQHWQATFDYIRILIYDTQQAMEGNLQGVNFDREPLGSSFCNNMSINTIHKALEFLGFQYQNPEDDATPNTHDKFGSTEWARTLVDPDSDWGPNFLGVIMRTTQSGGHFRYFAHDNSCWYDLDSLPTNRQSYQIPLTTDELLTHKYLLHPTSNRYRQNSKGHEVKDPQGRRIPDGQVRILPNILEVMSPLSTDNIFTQPLRTSPDYQSYLHGLSQFMQGGSSLISSLI